MTVKLEFLNDDFLLDSPTGRTLYHEIAADLPIVDFHCHIDPSWIADDKRFSNIAELWVINDPYKWRAMRINGVAERLTTGEAPAFEKFEAWAATVPRTIGNPLFHWSALELKRYFGVDEPLTPETAKAIWEHCNDLLRLPGYSTLGLLRKTNVHTLCTSDDVLDTLDWHRAATDRTDMKMLPSLRADSIINVTGAGFAGFCRSLARQTGVQVESLAAYKTALRVRLDAFHSEGCRLADIALDQPLYELAQAETIAAGFATLLQGDRAGAQAIDQLKTDLLLFLGEECSVRGWAMQLHVGAQRTTSHRLQNLVGAAGGYACIGRSSDIEPVAKFLNHLETLGRLPRTVLYTLNPSDMDMYASITGAFVEEGVPGKVQFGPAWWLNDNRDGIVRQLKALGNMGLLSRHIGMTTDSRSLLSFSRHEYYRRIFCNLIGGWADSGEIPHDIGWLSPLVRDVCYGNARDWVNGKPLSN